MHTGTEATDLAKLEPTGVWRWFDAIRRIPRPSGSELGMTDFLVGFARERGLEHLRDEVGNVLIRHAGRGPAASGRPVCLQAHTDMVAEKLDSSSHDFMTDPIRVEIDGDWVVARETTLGADNGMGVALMLAVLDCSDAVHPPLECLFTIDEERGLTGASRLDPAWLAARRMINLDTEEEGNFCIGCAGGLDMHLACGFEPAAAGPGLEAVSIRVDGLRGGHSGMEIGRWRANAIRVLARVLGVLLEEEGCLLSEMQGGSKRNAIPRTAKATVLLPAGGAARAIEAVSRLQKSQREEFARIDDELSITASAIPAMPGTAFPAEMAKRAVDLLMALHHGVEKMSGLSPDLVETSCNLATLEAAGTAIEICITARSLVEDAKQALADRIASTARLAGFSFETGGGYPGWKPDPSSELLACATESYRRKYGAEPEIRTIHAGLECGIIGDRVGGMDMISMGPDIRDVHAPGERVSISSTARFWDYFNGLLAGL